MVRNFPDDFEKVYAESTSFEQVNDVLHRKYLIETEVTAKIISRLKDNNFICSEVDFADIYSKYEATPPDWFWIEH